jgi:carbamoyl-phosphate synthase small subunit
MNTYSLLVLDDGTIYKGRAFGAPAPTADELCRDGDRASGEVVFNTGMSGYPEIVTDPSYLGQLVVMTSPHIGNYGVDENWSEYGAENEDGKPIIGLSGLIVRSLYNGLIPGKRMSLDFFLKKNNTPGIADIDTRALTLKLRDEGSSNGVIISLNKDNECISEDEKQKAVSYIKKFPFMEGRNLVCKTGVKERLEINETGVPYFSVIDCGIKTSIIRHLVSRGCRVTVVPSTVSSEEVLKLKSDCVLISNGPGDPSALKDLIIEIKKLIGKIPLTGICLGHQLISLALGAETEKMKFGHHGINHPVRDEETGRVFITSQNHGFTVKEDSFIKGMKVWLKNSNDNSIEGFKHYNFSILTTQFHPEAAPGPHDSLWIFDEFIKITKSASLKAGRQQVGCSPMQPKEER